MAESRRHTWAVGPGILYAENSANYPQAPMLPASQITLLLLTLCD